MERELQHWHGCCSGLALRSSIEKVVMGWGSQILLQNWKNILICFSSKITLSVFTWNISRRKDRCDEACHRAPDDSKCWAWRQSDTDHHILRLTESLNILFNILFHYISTQILPVMPSLMGLKTDRMIWRHSVWPWLLSLREDMPLVSPRS